MTEGEAEQDETPGSKERHAARFGHGDNADPRAREVYRIKPKIEAGLRPRPHAVAPGWPNRALNSRSELGVLEDEPKFAVGVGWIDPPQRVGVEGRDAQEVTPGCRDKAGRNRGAEGIVRRVVVGNDAGPVLVEQEELGVVQGAERVNG